MTEEEFYKEVAKLVGVESEYTDRVPIKPRLNREGIMVQPLTNATRWAGRQPGNGRFKGVGFVKVFNKNCIAVSFRNPDIYGVFSSFDDVLKTLETYYDN